MKRQSSRFYLFMVWTGLCFACARDEEKGVPHAGLAEIFPAPAHVAYDKDIVVNKLRAYCGPCHGVMPMRFIRSNNNSEVWDYIFAEKAPNSGKIWSDGIIEVLSWPSDDPPPFDKPMKSANQDWMPKGQIRLDFAKNKVDSKSARLYIVEALKQGHLQ